MGFSKRFVSTSQLLEIYHKYGYQAAKDWITEPDSLFIHNNIEKENIASDFVRLVFDYKDTAAENLLRVSIKEYLLIEKEMQDLQQKFQESQDKSILQKLQDLQQKLRKFL